MLNPGSYTTAAVYLAGYAVECMLKALILSNEPVTRNPQTLNTFRGASAHAFEWLKERLAERHVSLPATVAKELAKVNKWTTSLRYEPRTIKRAEADEFLAAARQITRWVDGRL